MSTTFLNKTALITGASSGIGEALALQLAQRGCDVALIARTQARLEQVASQIKGFGRKALVLPTDLTDAQATRSAVHTVLDTWGRIDFLFSNAGQYYRSPIAKLATELLRQSMEINFYSHVELVLSALPAMLARRSGHIVLISTMDAKKGIPPDTPYVAAKCALSGFGDLLRQELYGSGVEVTIAFPGRVDTPMIAHLSVPWISAKISAERCAKAILRGVERRKAEIILPPQALLLYYFQVFAPRVADFAVRFFHLEGWEHSGRGGL
ncbi:MAG: SDR family NAD(P)-dependent oxidoreductase [Anaerolineales bacterium]|nr:SDR family NAD(P)-dependent oxidoreductase [Anaerolineales bacterium]MDW8447268.1 SDR family NAD(P)-dependent oxidoreductase [Anaerolineales bacterium]